MTYTLQPSTAQNFGFQVTLSSYQPGASGSCYYNYTIASQVHACAEPLPFAAACKCSCGRLSGFVRPS